MEFTYKPIAGWISQSHIQNFMAKHHCKTYAELKSKASADTEWFWNAALSDMQLEFSKQPTKLLESGLPWPKWAVEGEISVVQNCIDRHLAQNSEKVAAIFEQDEEGEGHSWTFLDLAKHSSAIAEQLIQAGAKPGDRAALLMPMSPEMLASFFGVLRAGLSVVPIFSGYGKEAIATRIQDANVKFIFVQEKTTRRGKEVPVQDTLDSVLKVCPSVKKTFSLCRSDFIRPRVDQKIISPVPRPAESECLLLYTSGTTGKPKACVHTAFGVLATTGKEHRYSFDVHEEDCFFWYTDIGWMMGPWELIGSLQFGCKVVLFEGVPDYPDTNRIWRILDRHQVTHFGISPTAIRVLKKADESFLKSLELSFLRILGSTGEPWDEESWNWFFEKVGKKRCPIINISGGTEIMGCLLSPSPLDPLKPMSLGGPALGVNAQIWSEEGKEVSEGIGHLVCLSPLPSMTKGFLNNPKKYLESYFEKFGESVWYHGDWAFRDEDGQWFLKGRSDDTIKVAGKRVGPNEYESALMKNSLVAEVAAAGIPHDIKGESVHCFVVLKDAQQASEDLSSQLKKMASDVMGKALAPEKIHFVTALPKTRSGKILRGLIRKIVLQENFDSSSVENLDSLEELKKVRL